MALNPPDTSKPPSSVGMTSVKSKLKPLAFTLNPAHCAGGIHAHQVRLECNRPVLRLVRRPVGPGSNDSPSGIRASDVSQVGPRHARARIELGIRVPSEGSQQPAQTAS